ncbi:hypothetical protein SLE2022_022160 [Rubroshorea leprosula]
MKGMIESESENEVKNPNLDGYEEEEQEKGENGVEISSADDDFDSNEEDIEMLESVESNLVWLSSDEEGVDFMSYQFHSLTWGK